MEPMAVKESMKQIVPGYLPYLLLTFLKLYVTHNNDNNNYKNVNNTAIESYPIGVIIGPGITIGNMAVAGSANKKMLNELYQYNIQGRDFQKGETVYGIIGVRDMGYSPISVKNLK